MNAFFTIHDVDARSRLESISEDPALLVDYVQSHLCAGDTTCRFDFVGEGNGTVDDHALSSLAIHGPLSSQIPIEVVHQVLENEELLYRFVEHLAMFDDSLDMEDFEFAQSGVSKAFVSNGIKLTRLIQAIEEALSKGNVSYKIEVGLIAKAVYEMDGFDWFSESHLLETLRFCESLGWLQIVRNSSRHTLLFDEMELESSDVVSSIVIQGRPFVGPLSKRSKLLLVVSFLSQFVWLNDLEDRKHFLLKLLALNIHKEFLDIVNVRPGAGTDKRTSVSPIKHLHGFYDDKAIELHHILVFFGLEEPVTVG